MPTKSKTSSNRYIFSVGRRRSAVATVKLHPKKGESTVNAVPLAKYFSRQSDKIVYNLPFVLTDTVDKFSFDAIIRGGGLNGQLKALVLAISRSLVKHDPDFKPLLRPQGLLTVDSRVRQRRQVGTGGKARRQKQSPKR